jgi:hypothetical protein
MSGNGRFGLIFREIGYFREKRLCYFFVSYTEDERFLGVKECVFSNKYLGC